MDRTLLRTMTLKSPMKFGKYKDFTVGEVIDTVADYKWFLWGCYYQLGMVSFSDEVLTKLGITKEFRISKPGKLTLDEAREKKYVLKAKLSESEIMNISQRTKRENKLYRGNRAGKWDFVKRKSQTINMNKKR